ncbi:nitroreductase family protein [Acidaminobacter sp.]|uniref:nitroreductase family protein n=1 Tax=Acidaminobacter sp. TaxID=1872102 RepID=UPI00255FD2AD|nr:nitroreductase family protein [Acidaminobacter sp.]MDK9710548.1 nitroreductase family protein [Acidaminobacter sp.]
MNYAFQMLMNRRSVRSYRPDPVPKNVLERIMETTVFAPSARGAQPWHFSVVTDAELLKRISGVNREIALSSGDERLKASAEDPNFSNFYNAPAVIFISAPEAKHALADCANAAVYASLAATALGLGSCYIASFRPAFDSEHGAELKSALLIPEGHNPLYAVAVGYTSGAEPKAAPRVQGLVSWIG